METTGAKKSVLFAEDDDAMRRFVEIILQKENYQVTAVEDGLKAMQIAIENDFDVIIADAIMPMMTGFDLCRIIRQNADKKHVPFIILSGIEQDTKDDAAKCLADIYLLKDENLKENLRKALAEIFI